MSAHQSPYRFAASAAPIGFHESEGGHRAHEDWYRSKFRHWRGRSGRSYVFSAYAPRECPAYLDAVLLVARADGAPLACLDLGAMPEAALDEARRRFHDHLDEVEFQVHVLSDTRAERVSLIVDLIPRAA